MKTAITSICLLISLVVLFVIIDRRDFYSGADVVKQEDSTEENIVSETTKELNTTTLNTYLASSRRETDLELNTKEETIVNDNKPAAIPLLTIEEAKIANEEALMELKIKTAEINRKRIVSTIKQTFFVVLTILVSLGIVFVLVKNRSDFSFSISDFTKNWRYVISLLLTTVFTCLLFMLIKNSLPRSEDIILSYAIMNRVGKITLGDKDIIDTRIYYATEEDPVLSERQTVNRSELLPDYENLFKHELKTTLPKDCISVRIDLTYDKNSILNAKENEYPEVLVKINGKRISKDDYMINRWNLDSRVTFPITIEKNVLHASSQSLYSAFFSILFILLVVVLIVIRVLSPQQVLKTSFLTIFFLMSLFPIIKFNLQKESEQENRTLESFPSFFYFDKASNYFSQIELWFNDRFFGREKLIAFSDNIMAFFDDDRGSERVLKGTDNWLFFKGSLPEAKMKNVFSEEKMRSAGEYLNSINKYARSNGKEFIFVICPDKFRIYGDKSRYYSSDLYLKDDVVDKFVDYLQTNYEFPVLYQRKDLLKKRDELSHDLYYKYDTHWTQEGAFYGFYLPVISCLSIDPIDVESWLEKDSQGGDLINMLTSDNKKANINPQKYYTAVFKRAAIIEEEDDPGNANRKMIKASNPSGIKNNILFYRDSFTTAAVDLFSNTFQKSVFLWRNPNKQFDMDYISQSDIIVFERVERNVIDLSSMNPINFGEQ